MLRKDRSNQTGYVLLLTLLVLMGIGGVVAAGFTQEAKKQVDRERYLHNQRVLREAKRALLQYAYHYPEFNAEGPGRLPCPDDDNDGLTGALSLPLCTSVGRLPWAEPELDFYDARDASNERLWYAVSDNFYNLGGGGVINSDSTGTIAIEDSSGAPIFDATAGGGVAAVIIAPGSAIDRNGTLQDRAADPNDPVNYLDLFGAVDNADFVNGAANGFVTGPIENRNTGILLVNDQMIVITAAEVIAMAERATLQAYREALRDYDARLDADLGNDDYYPWLYNYDVIDLADYPSRSIFATEIADYLGRVGRVPSIYTDYFTESTGQPIESHLGVDLTLSFPLSPGTVSFSQASARCPSDPSTNCTGGTIEFDAANNVTFNETSIDPMTGVQFVDLGAPGDNDGRLTADVATNETFSIERYYWDEEPVGNGWEQCPAGGDDLTDCHRDGGLPNPGGTHGDPIQVMRVQFDLIFNGTITFDTDYSVAPAVAVVDPPDGTRHANIRGSFNGNRVVAVTLPVSVTYDWDHYYLAGYDIQSTGNLDLSDLLTGGGSLALTLRYYPELPTWVFANAWHESVQMGYAADYLPNGPGGPCTAGTDCLQIVNLAGIANNKVSLFALAAQHDWVDNGVAGFSDDVSDVFDAENDDLDDVFDRRAVGGNDELLVMEEI